MILAPVVVVSTARVPPGADHSITSININAITFDAIVTSTVPPVVMTELYIDMVEK